MKRNWKMTNDKKPDPQPGHGKDDKGHGGRPIPTPPSSASGISERE
jgi:hypothetical protein